jgi:hypothetical protein
MSTIVGINISTTVNDVTKPARKIKVKNTMPIKNIII